MKILLINPKSSSSCWSLKDIHEMLSSADNLNPPLSKDLSNLDEMDAVLTDFPGASA